ncbi:MAG: MBL fold metallo-hydrolase [Desulfovibrionaceae bacterium]|nr:MBL fold metallo-hydrolase [Desulfovibrionaceae bacterium]
MKIHFWGTRGSVPASLGHAAVRAKVRAALEIAVQRGLPEFADIDAFIDELPFAVRGTYGANTSCVQVDAGGPEYLICDAGTGLRDFGNAMLAAHGGAPQTYHIFLSHLHWDHIQGLPFFVPAYIPDNRIVFHSGHAEAETALRVQHASPFFPVDFDELGAEIEFRRVHDGGNLAVGDVDVSVLRLRHPGDSFGYAFAHRGRRVVYATDNEHTHEPTDPKHPLHRFVQDADLLIFDAQYTYAEAATSKRDWGHSSNMAAVEVAAAQGVRRLALFHQEPGQSDAMLDKFLAQTRHFAELAEGGTPEVFMAYDGLRIEV